MNTNHFYSIFLLGFLFLTVGCDKTCLSTVQDYATIQNTTGRTLTLNVCKGRNFGEVQAMIVASGVDQNVSLGSHEGTTVQGGLDASKSCSASTSKMQMGITLAPSSFGQVKLCYDPSSNVNIVVENYQSCPSGYLVQTTTGSCNTL